MPVAVWRAVSAVLLVATIWLASVIVRLENFHYGTVVGVCDGVPNPLVREEFITSSNDRHDCLHATETRTSALWHLYYALTDIDE